MSYLGSKGGAGVYQAIIAAMPPHDTYIETHLGNGMIAQMKPRARESTGIDIDPHVIGPATPAAMNVDRLVCGDAIAYLRTLPSVKFIRERVLIYCDPPYLLSTRTGHDRYRYEYDESDHLKLIAALQDASAQGALVMLSGYPNHLYNCLLPRWRKIEFQAMTRGGVRTECLWMNYPAGAVFCADYAGSDFTDRQRVKRKAERWARNYAVLPAGERLAILRAILETHSS